MQNDDIAQLAYLAVLAIAVMGWFIAENRKSMGKATRQAVVWGLIFIGVIAGAGLWSDIRDDVMPRQSVLAPGVVEVPRAPDGHYYLVLHLNDKAIEFIVDTGASDVVLSLEDAKNIGLNIDDLVFSGTANTANGTVSTARARIRDVRLGDFQDVDLRVSVNGGDMQGSLLGMTYLRRFDSIEIKGDRLILTR
ncbi:MAG: TIGR02281 family clan AA aspartic protease [Paracoccaceae bacterium]